MKMAKGKKNWIFCDGYLPPKGDNPEFEGHEALMLTNLTNKKAEIELVLVFEDKDPVGGIFVSLDGMRTTCVRMDKPLGEKKVQLMGQERPAHLRLLRQTRRAPDEYGILQR